MTRIGRDGPLGRPRMFLQRAQRSRSRCDSVAGLLAPIIGCPDVFRNVSTSVTIVESSIRPRRAVYSHASSVLAPVYGGIARPAVYVPVEAPTAGRDPPRVTPKVGGSTRNAPPEHCGPRRPVAARRRIAQAAVTLKRSFVEVLP